MQQSYMSFWSIFYSTFTQLRDPMLPKEFWRAQLLAK
jgi:hypothetical protein